MLRLWFAIVTAAVLSGCGALIRSEVSVFHDLGDRIPQTYALVPFKEQQGSLEHKTYENVARQHLNAKGLREVRLEQAEVLVFVQYGIDDGREVVSSYPIFGQTGTSSSDTTGTIQNYGGGYATYSGTTTRTPTYGVIGAGTASSTVYSRFLRLDLLDRTALVNGAVKKLLKRKFRAAAPVVSYQPSCLR